MEIEITNIPKDRYESVKRNIICMLYDELKGVNIEPILIEDGLTDEIIGVELQINN